MNQNRVFHQPDFLPTKWFYLLASLVGVVIMATVAASLHYADLESRITAQEQSTIRVSDDLKYRTQLKDKIMDKLDSIDRRLSTIEGRLGVRK